MDDRPLEDRQLLQRFVKDHSQEAFAALTARYLSLVYSTCRRELGDSDLAEDVTQAVFLTLARKAPSLRREVVLSGWLFQTARFAAKNARLREQRRKAYEQKAAEALEEQQMETEDAAWTEIEPLLNQSLAALRDTERECVLLRFFQGVSFAEAGATLGLSEEATRKRVNRALEKMRQIFVKNGVIVPSAALAVLLTTHASETTSAACAAGVIRVTAGAVAGQISANLIGLHVYQITEGTLKTMNIVKAKTIAGATALTLFGTTAVFGTITAELLKKELADSTPSKYRTVALTGRVRSADGAPLGHIHISAQVQDAYFAKMTEKEDTGHFSTPGEIEEAASLAHTKPDGTYTIYVGAGIPYNVTVVPENLMAQGEDDGYVAAAVEGVSGAKGAKIPVPDLTLVRGGFVTGTVTDKASGKPLDNVSVGSYGPERPPSSAMIVDTLTNDMGRYRLRVAPGSNRVYVADGRYNGSGDQIVTVAEGQSVIVDFQAVPKPPTPTSFPKIYVPSAK